jgi:Kef-type K+ transport system membrane component KefB
MERSVRLAAVSFTELAVICAAGLLGPLLALPRQWHLPIVLGELLAGVVLGKTGVSYLDAHNETFTLLADIGFALVMFVAGTHVPVRDPDLRPALRTGLIRACAVGLIAAALGVAISAAFNTGHAALYAVLMASSSAALILPIVDSLRLGGRLVLQLLPQVAIADTACIVALPLVIDPHHAARAALGTVAVAACGIALFVALNTLERNGLRKRAHRVSEARRFALELRVNLAILFALAGLATHTHVSIMLAGFAFGLAVAAVGEPRRLARQLFAVTDGFLAPLFFVWLGASLNLRDLARHPSFVVLGAALGVGAVAAHLAMRLFRQPLSLGLLGGAQLGVPVAAATIGTQLQVLKPGESSALILGAVITIAASVLGGALAVRAGLVIDDAPAG